MVDLTPNDTFLIALSNRFNASRQGQSLGAGSTIPGLATAGVDTGQPSAALGVAGISSGGVPGTATTGSSVAESIGSGIGGSTDPVAQQVAATLSAFQQREPGERGDLGAGVTGGDLNTLLSVLGGPTAALSILGSLVASNELGLPPATSPNALLEASGALGGNLAFGTPQQRETLQDSRDISPPGFDTGRTSRQLSPAQAESLFRSTGRRSIAEQIRERSTGPDRGSGRSPNRGTVSNAGR